MKDLLMMTLAVLALLNTAGAGDVEFIDDVLPIVKEHCIDCHGPEEQESKLRLDSMLHALSGGDSGERIVVPGKSDESYLIELVTHADASQRMPPDADPLTKAEIDVFRAWIDNKLSWQPIREELSKQSVDHWSLKPLTRPAVPESDFANPIDAFIARKLFDKDLRISETADRHRLIRRLYLVMHGMPPTPEQIRAFVDDKRHDVWEQMVDHVLDSPRYGERLAMHWLDLVRFGETTGYETNRERPNAWHYRDWVINAFNDDKRYDEFIIEQIAGDAVGAEIGTGFLVAGPNDIVKGQDPKLGLMQRQDELADMINTTGTAFLGLTLGCARCHNHKFDPVTQTDYYSLQAVFAGVNHADRKLPASEEVKSELEKVEQQIGDLNESLAKFIPHHDPNLRPPVNAKRNVEAFDAVTARFVRMTINAADRSEPCIDELEIFADDQNVALASAGAKPTSSGDFVHPLHKLAQINDGEYGNAKSWISSTRSGGWVQIALPQEFLINRIVWGRDRKEQYKDRLATEYVIEISVDAETWTKVASSADRQPFKNKPTSKPNYDFESFPEPEAEQGRTQLTELNRLTERKKELQQGTLVYAGTFSQPGPTHRLYRGEPGAKREEVSPDAIAAIGRLELSRDSAERDRRFALAKWIASPNHPLTARVLVNRLWQFHFGTGIVDTPSDFGGNGTVPTHGELLDWLAAEFIESGWSIKHMQRLILSSKTWQQDSRPKEDAMRIDAASRLLWRFPPRRLEAEGIRDCILAATGKLDLSVGGPGFSAFEVEMENVRHYHPKKEYGPADWRRMIYMTKVRQERDTVFGVFDCPDGSQVTPSRSRSTTPLQALNLLNSRFVVQQSELLAERVQNERETIEGQIRRAYELCFGREPDESETAAAMRFIERHGFVQFARAMFNANELVFIP